MRDDAVTARVGGGAPAFARERRSSSARERRRFECADQRDAGGKIDKYVPIFTYREVRESLRRLTRQAGNAA